MSFTVVRSMSGKYWHVIVNDNKRNPVDVCHTKREAMASLVSFERIGSVA